MKNCLVIVKNKKLNNDFSVAEEISRAFSSGCYYFDKTAIIAYDESLAITAQAKDTFDNYDNAVFVCGSAQTQALRKYLSELYSSPFDSANIINASGKTVALVSEEEEIKTKCGLIVSLLNEKYNVSYDKMYVKCVGAPAETINNAISQSLKLTAEMTFAVFDDYGDQTIEITYSSNTPKMVTDGVLRILTSNLEDYIYAFEDISLAQRLYQLLKLRRMKISIAESFTGGGICKKLVEVPGVSEVFVEGLNTYSNLSKIKRLGVSELTLKQYGAVSDETAFQMADGLIKTGDCDVSVATTGIAGPKSDNTSKPVGLAYIAVGLKEQVSVYKFNFKGDRDAITKTAINRALFLVYKTLK